jgi:hypothetical protein
LPFATTLTVESLRARAARLQQLNLGLAEEVARWKNLESPLLDAERQAYLKCIQDGIGSLDAAWHALTTAVARMEKDAAAMRGGFGVAALAPRPSLSSPLNRHEVNPQPPR